MAAATALRLLASVSQQQNAPGFQDCADAHRDRVNGYVLNSIENRALSSMVCRANVFNAGPRSERTARLIEGDNARPTQCLESANQFRHNQEFAVRTRHKNAWKLSWYPMVCKCFARRYVYMLEKVLMHEVVVAA